MKLLFSALVLVGGSSAQPLIEPVARYQITDLSTGYQIIDTKAANGTLYILYYDHVVKRTNLLTASYVGEVRTRVALRVSGRTEIALKQLFVEKTGIFVLSRNLYRMLSDGSLLLERSCGNIPLGVAMLGGKAMVVDPSGRINGEDRGIPSIRFPRARVCCVGSSVAVVDTGSARVFIAGDGVKVLDLSREPGVSIPLEQKLDSRTGRVLLHLAACDGKNLLVSSATAGTKVGLAVYTVSEAARLISSARLRIAVPETRNGVRGWSTLSPMGMAVDGSKILLVGLKGELWIYER